MNISNLPIGSTDWGSDSSAAFSNTSSAVSIVVLNGLPDIVVLVL